MLKITPKKKDFDKKRSNTGQHKIILFVSIFN